MERIAPGAVLDRYEVVRALGEGGMATVYQVRHRTLRTHHALKVLLHGGASVRERLLLEGRVQGALRHPNVLSVTDIIDVDGAPGLILDYVDGPSLEDWLGEQTPPLAQALILFSQILAGVRSAHAAGVIHRDLKPANVLLDTVDGQFVVRVADFGLAKALDASPGLGATRSGLAMGTPSYMSPEQIRDAKNVDKRTDIFALGAILYELVGGRMAFVGRDMLEIFNAVAQGAYTPIRELVPDVPVQVEQAIVGALAVSADSRIGSCEELLDVLERRRAITPERVDTRTVGGFWEEEAAAPAPELPVRATPQAPAGLVGLGLPPSAQRAAPPPRPPRPPAPSGGSFVLDVDEPAPSRPRWVFGVGALGLGATFVFLLAVWGWTGAEPEDDTRVDDRVSASMDVLLEPEVVDEPVAVERAPIVEDFPAEAAPEPVVRSAPRSLEAASPAAPAEAEVSTALAPTARITVRGADRVRLLGVGGPRSPGEVPPGTYEVEATFGDRVVPGAGRVTVRAGQRVELSCDADFGVCE